MLKSKPKREYGKKRPREDIILIKLLAAEGISNRIIGKIIDAKESYVWSVKTGKLNGHIVLEEGEELVLDEVTKRRVEVVRKIMEGNDLPTSDYKQNLIYIQLLRYFGFSKEQIYKIYNHKSKKYISNLLWIKDVDLWDFDSTLLGIERKDYLDFMIDIDDV